MVGHAFYRALPSRASMASRASLMAANVGLGLWALQNTPKNTPHKQVTTNHKAKQRFKILVIVRSIRPFAVVDQLYKRDHHEDCIGFAVHASWVERASLGSLHVCCAWVGGENQLWASYLVVAEGT